MIDRPSSFSPFQTKTPSKQVKGFIKVGPIPAGQARRNARLNLFLGFRAFDFDDFPAGVISAGGTNVMRLHLAVALRAILQRGSDDFQVISSFSLTGFGIFSFWLRRHFIFSFL